MPNSALLRRQTATTQTEDIETSKQLAQKVIDSLGTKTLGEPIIQALGPGTFEVAFKGLDWKIRGLHQDDKVNLKIDGPKGTVGDHKGTMEEACKALNQTIQKKGSLWGRDDKYHHREDQGALRQIQQAMSVYLKDILGKLYVPGPGGNRITLKQFLNGQPVSTIFQSDDPQVRQMGYRVRSEAEKFLKGQFDESKVNLFKQTFGTNVTDWFSKKVLQAGAKRASLLTLYHGTTAQFDEFELHPGYRSYGPFSEELVENHGIFLTDNPEFAKTRGDRLITCQVSFDDQHWVDLTWEPLRERMDNVERVEVEGGDYPYKWVGDPVLDALYEATGDDLGKVYNIVRWGKNDWELFDNKKFVDALKRRGFIGAVFEEDDYDSGAESKTYMVFDPTKIKITNSETPDKQAGQQLIKSKLLQRKDAASWGAFIKGEYWLYDDGSDDYADGDIGDQNHEGIALDRIFNSKDHELNEAFTAFLAAHPEQRENYQEFLDEEGEFTMEGDFGEGGWCSFDAEQGIPNEVGYAVFGKDGWNEIRGDVRTYYMKHFGAAHVIDNNFGVWKLTAKMMDAMQDFILGQMESEDLDTDCEINIEEISTHRWVTLEAAEFLSMKQVGEVFRVAQKTGKRVKSKLLQKQARPDQWDTPAFKSWFGASKIVNSDGSPMRCFHGTDSKFEAFKDPNQRFEGGRVFNLYSYVTTDPDYAHNFGGSIMPLYAKALNPLDLRQGASEWVSKADFIKLLKAKGITVPELGDKNGDWVFGWVHNPEVKKAAQAAGYDAIWLRESNKLGQGSADEGDALLLFKPSQLKSAWVNSGEFDPENPRLTASKQAAEFPEYVYHSTHLNKLENISIEGLQPSGGSQFSGGWDWNSKGRIFFSDWAGVYFWTDRMEQIAHSNSDFNGEEDFGWCPIVLRMDSAYLGDDDVQHDPEGHRDSGINGSWFITEAIEPDILEVWDGRKWAPVDSVDIDLMFERVKDASHFESDSEDGLMEDEEPDGWWELDFEALHPKTASAKVAEGPMIHSKGCVMIRPDEHTAKLVLGLGAMLVKDEEVYEDPEDPSFGRETTPHVTCLWGIDEILVGYRVARVARDHAPKEMKILNITLFPADGRPYDVVKFDMDPTGLKEFHDALLAEFPDTKETFDYHPHMTISYVKAGMGERVIARARAWEGKVVPTSVVVYSRQDGGEELFPVQPVLAEEPSAPEAKQSAKLLTRRTTS